MGVLSKRNNKTPLPPDLGTGGLLFVVNQNGGTIALWLEFKNSQTCY